MAHHMINTRHAPLNQPTAAHRADPNQLIGHSAQPGAPHQNRNQASLASSHHTAQQSHVNLNFTVLPSAQGPMIVQQGVTVQPGTLDNVFAQLKYQHRYHATSRPVSARNNNFGGAAAGGGRNDSFHSAQSWDGAINFRSAAIRVGPHRGDRPGLGRHYNPTRQRRRHSSNRRDNSRGNHTHSQDEGCAYYQGAGGDSQGQVRSPYLEISNVDTNQMPYAPRQNPHHNMAMDHPLTRLDAESQTDLQEDVSAFNDAAVGSDGGLPITMDVAVGNECDVNHGSVSPEGRKKPTSQVAQYTMPARAKIGVGPQINSSDLIASPSPNQHSTQSDRHMFPSGGLRGQGPLGQGPRDQDDGVSDHGARLTNHGADDYSQDRRQALDSEDRRGDVHCEIGGGRQGYDITESPGAGIGFNKASEQLLQSSAEAQRMVRGLAQEAGAALGNGQPRFGPDEVADTEAIPSPHKSARSQRKQKEWHQSSNIGQAVTRGHQMAGLGQAATESDETTAQNKKLVRNGTGSGSHSHELIKFKSVLNQERHIDWTEMEMQGVGGVPSDTISFAAPQRNILGTHGPSDSLGPASVATPNNLISNQQPVTQIRFNQNEGLNSATGSSPKEGGGGGPGGASRYYNMRDTPAFESLRSQTDEKMQRMSQQSGVRMAAMGRQGATELAMTQRFSESNNNDASLTFQGSEQLPSELATKRQSEQLLALISQAKPTPTAASKVGGKKADKTPVVPITLQGVGFVSSTVPKSVTPRPSHDPSAALKSHAIGGPISPPHSARLQEHSIYNLSNQVDLFTARADQTGSSTQIQVTPVGTTGVEVVAGGGDTTDSDAIIFRKQIHAKTLESEEGQGNGEAPRMTTDMGGMSMAEKLETMEQERQNSLQSNLVWQASLGGANDLDTKEDLKVVDEEDPSFVSATKFNNPHTLSSATLSGKPVDLKRRKSSLAAASSSAKTSARSSKKTVGSVSKKKKKTSSLSKTLKSSVTTPALPTSSLGRLAAASGRASPAAAILSMKVGSVKSSAALQTTGKAPLGPKKTGSKLVLKSNTAMAAELPKNLPKAASVRSAAEKAMKKKLQEAQKKRAEDLKSNTNNALEELHTPRNVMTPPELDQLTPYGEGPMTPSEQPECQEISLISTKVLQKQGSNESNADSDLKIALSKSVVVVPSKMENGKSQVVVGGGLFADEDLSPGMRSMMFHNTMENLQNPSQMPPRIEVKGTTRRPKNERKGSRNESHINLSQSNMSSRSPTKSTTKSFRELQVLEIPPEYDTDSNLVVEYMLGDKAVEIEAPLYQVNIANKLVYQLTTLSGEEPPSFIKLVQNKLGRRVIRIRQKETTGVQQLVQLKLEVRNPDTNVKGVYKCRVFVRPGTKLLLRKALFTSPIDYCIKGPARVLAMPVYSAKHDDLDFYLESADPDLDLPSFVKVSRDSDGNRVIKCHGSDSLETGTYQIKVIARDKLTRVTNDDFDFTVVGTPGIEVAHLPPEYAEEIKVDPNQACIQLAMPTFNLETVKEEEAAPLEYSLVMLDGSKVPDFIFIKALEEGQHIIELKAAELPPGLNTVFEVQLKVYDPNVDATQLIPISVKCPEPNLMLLPKKLNFPASVKYHSGSKALLLKVPLYERNDGKDLSEPLLMALASSTQTHTTCQSPHALSRVASVWVNDQGEQFIKVECDDSKLKGTYMVKVYATEAASGLTNQDVSFELQVLESVLTLAETPNVCFLGKPLMYQPKGPPTYVPLPQYTIQRAQIQFKLVSSDASKDVPNFVRVTEDYLVVEGSQNPTCRDYNLRLQAFDPVSESRDEMELKVSSDIFEIHLEKIPFASPVEFYLGNETILPMPLYKQEPFEGELTYELEIKGVGMMLGGIELASIQANSEGEPTIRIGGGQNSDKGTYQVTVSAIEKSLGVVNKEAVFMVEAKPQLKMIARPVELDQIETMQIGQVYKLPVPTYASSQRLRYYIQEKDGSRSSHEEDHQGCPSFITVKCPKQAQPYIEVRSQVPHSVPSKANYDFELIACDNQQHNVENVQEFSVQFDLEPRLVMTSFQVPMPFKYTLGDVPLELDLPTYESYLVDLGSLSWKLQSDFTGLEVPFARVDLQRHLIVIETDNGGYEGIHDVSVVVATSQLEQLHEKVPARAVSNKAAQFRLEISPPTDSGSGSQPSIQKRQQASSPTHRAELLKAQPSNETLCLHQADHLGRPLNDDDHHDIYYQNGGAASKAHLRNPAGSSAHEIGDKISQIEGNAEDDIPIYYSDATSDKFQVAAESVEVQNAVGEVRHERQVSSGRARQESNGPNVRQFAPATTGSSPRVTESPAKTMSEANVDGVHSTHQGTTDHGDDVVVVNNFIDEGMPQRGVGGGGVHEHDDDDGHVANMLIESEMRVGDSTYVLPKDQIEMLIRENEEMRQQIADVRSQMDQSIARVVQAHLPIQNQAPSQPPNLLLQASEQAASFQIESPPHGGFTQEQASQLLAHQLHQSMQGLLQGVVSSHQNPSFASPQSTAGIDQQQRESQQVFDEAILQEDAILNSQLRQRIEQSKMRQLQQMSELDRIRSEVNQGQVAQQQQLLNRYLNDTHHGPQREKDIRLRQLRTQLAQLQEQRASLRKQCTSLKQKEDDLRSDIFLRDQQMKSSTTRNDTETTKVSSVFNEIDRAVYKNDNLRSEVNSLEEQLEEKKALVSRNKAKLRDLDTTQTELEDKLTTQRHRVAQLRLEMESAKRRLDHQQPTVAMRDDALSPRGVHQQPSGDLTARQMQTATFSPPGLNDSKLLAYQRGGAPISQLRNQQQAIPPLRLQQTMGLEMLPDYIHQGGAVSARNNYSSGNYQSNNSQQYAHTFGNAQTDRQPQGGLSHTTAYAPNQHVNPRGGRFNQTMVAYDTAHSAFTPTDPNDMPAAGMPSEKRQQREEDKYVTNQQTQQVVMSGQGARRFQGYEHKSYYSGGGGGSSEKKIINPRPQKPYKPKENNIFGSPSQQAPRPGQYDSPQSDADRFQTTYTQFTNREKFRGLREGENGGLRVHNVPQDGVCRLEQFRRSAGSPFTQMSAARQHLAGHRSEGRAVNRRVGSDQFGHGPMSGGGGMQSRFQVANYEKRYQY